MELEGSRFKQDEILSRATCDRCGCQSAMALGYPLGLPRRWAPWRRHLGVADGEAAIKLPPEPFQNASGMPEKVVHAGANNFGLHMSVSYHICAHYASAIKNSDIPRL